MPQHLHAGAVIADPGNRDSGSASVLCEIDNDGQHRTGAATDMEVHIRKLDTDKKLHWRLLSSVPVQASAEAIWQVLTNYGQLDEVVPLLLVSEEKKAAHGETQDSSSQTKLKRIRQVAAKQLPYVQLHTEVVLDVLEKPGTDTWELQFKHHRSSFDMLQVPCLILIVTLYCSLILGSPCLCASVLD